MTRRRRRGRSGDPQIERWQQPIIAVHHHRTVQRPQRGLQPASSHTSGGIAFGFRSPETQRRRVRWACTRNTVSAT